MNQNPIERLKKLGITTGITVAIFAGVALTSATAYVVYNFYAQDAYGYQWKPGGRG